ncbi:MAG: Cna B-type domain-containing protein [Oscillospiraceae bacterium]|jgi:pilin isopeptide linkage protein|nr:Cna B-type domain-containing protein [Oscillospiraceae bacterium]
MRKKVYTGTWYKATALVLTVVCAVSAFLSGAYAWNEQQSYTNDFRGTVAKTSVVLHKTEKSADGDIIARPVPNATFLLFKQAYDGSWTQIGGIYTTNESGKITVEKLNSGHYEFVEQAPGYGYTYDKDTDGFDIRTYPFDITPDDAEGAAIVAVEAYNRRLQSGLEITKTVLMGDDTPLGELQTAQEFEFTVSFGDGGTYDYRIDGGEKQALQSGGKLTLRHGGKAVFENLPVGLYYEIHEAANVDYVTSSKGNTGNIELNQISKAEFSNIYGKPEPKQTKIIVQKIVAGEIPDSEKEREFGFNIVINGGSPVHFTLKAGEEKTFVLDSGDTYSISEDDPFALGYIQSGVINGAGTAWEPEITAVYTNTFIGDIFIDISGEKTWDLKNDPAAQMPASIIVELLADGTAAQTVLVKPDKDGKWLYTFRAPKYGKDKKEIVYTVREVAVPNFISTVTGTNIKNTWVETVTDAPAKVKKTVIGTAPANADTFIFKLEPLNGAPMPIGDTISVLGEGEGSFGDIQFLTAGTYTYRVSEVKGAATCVYDETVYTLTVAVAEENGKLVVKSAKYAKPDGDKTDIAAFVNDYGIQGKTAVSVTKVWDGGENSAQPESISVQLFMDGQPHGDPAVLNAAGNWHYTWNALEEGHVWSVDESAVPDGYTKTIAGDAASGFVITNTFTQPSDDEVIVSGSKRWEHGDNPIVNRPDAITVYIKDGDQIAAQAVVTAENNWAWSFKLPKNRADGTAIQYTVDEDTIDGYTKTVRGYDLINTHGTSKIDFITLDGKKTWNYGIAPAADRPDSIMVYIKNGDETVKKITVTAADGWKWSVQLPKYNSKGNAIAYTIDEANVPHYTHKINGMEIVNTYKDQNYPGDAPETGGGGNIWMWAILAAGSGIVAIVMLFAERKNKRTTDRYARSK